MSPKKATEKKRRGRPATVSRADICEAALELVNKYGAEGVTIGRLCESLGITAKTVYNHVSGRDAILDGVVELVFEQLELEIPSRATWQAQGYAWVSAVYTHLVDAPNVAPLLGQRGAIAPSWIAQIGRLGRILDPAGLDDEDYAIAMQALTHLATTLPLAAHFTAQASPVTSIHAALGATQQPDATHLLRLTNHVAAESVVFDVVVRATLDSIAAGATTGKRQRKSAAPARPRAKRGSR